jgi:hypothetical protein
MVITADDDTAMRFLLALLSGPLKWIHVYILPYT